MAIVYIIVLGLFVKLSYDLGQDTSDVAKVAATCFFIAAPLLYFSPTIVAAVRKHTNTMSIGILNLFLGWTVLGWVAALVWAHSAKAQVVATIVPTHQGGPTPAGDLKTCPFCAEQIKAQAIVCRYCQKEQPPPPKAPLAKAPPFMV